jgi:predicted nucleic acid-binding protein
MTSIADANVLFPLLVRMKPNLWADAWLAALVMSLDYEKTTFDRGFKSFRALKLRLLEMPDR